MRERSRSIEELKKIYEPCPEHGWEGATIEDESFYCTGWDAFHKRKCFYHFRQKGQTIRKGRTKILSRFTGWTEAALQRLNLEYTEIEPKQNKRGNKTKSNK